MARQWSEACDAVVVTVVESSQRCNAQGRSCFSSKRLKTGKLDCTRWGEGESREFLGLWITSGAIYEAKRRRATQDITCSFPYGKWLHMIGARASPDCELCKRERQQWKEAIDNIPAERDVKRKEERHRGPQLLEVSSRRHL